MSESVVQVAAPESHEFPDTSRLLIKLRPSITQRMLLNTAIDNIDETLGRLRGIRRNLLALQWTHETHGTLFRREEHCIGGGATV